MKIMWLQYATTAKIIYFFHTSRIFQHIYIGGGKDKSCLTKIFNPVGVRKFNALRIIHAPDVNVVNILNR